MLYLFEWIPSNVLFVSIIRYIKNSEILVFSQVFKFTLSIGRTVQRNKKSNVSSF